MLDIKEKKQIRERDVRENSKLKRKDILNTGHSFPILKEPHITEKSAIFNELNQYVFKIWPRANKILVKKKIEDIYKVKVEKVRIINVHSKKRKLGRSQGYKKGYKKAVVTLKPGQKIDILPK